MAISIQAECQKCYKVCGHVRGLSSHTCPDKKCGGQLNCGYEDCVEAEKMAKKREEPSDDVL
jgi:hypothetical protein